MTSIPRDIGATISLARANPNLAITAGTGQDGQSQTGEILDLAAHRYPQSVVFAIPFTATLAANETLTVAFAIQHGNAANMSDATTFLSRAAQVVATGPAGGGTVTGVAEFDVNISGARRYVRCNYTPDLSRSGTDTAALSGVAVFGGAKSLPQ